MAVASISPHSDRIFGLITPMLNRMVQPEVFSLPADVGNDSRVLVIDSGDLTEVLFFAPILRYLKDRCPGMRVTYLVREGNSELVRTMSQISEMITYEPPHLAMSSTTYLALLKRVRSRDFNIAFLLGKQFNFARSLLALFTGAKIRVGFSSERTFPFINCEIRSGNSAAYEATRVQTFLTVLGMQGFDNLPSWTLPDQDIRWAKQMVHFHKPEKDKRLIAVDPGLGKGGHRLVDSTFSYLTNQLAKRLNCKVFVLTNSLDKKRLSAFRARLNSEIFDIKPKNVKEGLALLSRVDLFLSGNTDLFHFAVSMRVPTVGLFTRQDEASWFPKDTPWVQIMQGVKGQRLSVNEFNSKIDTLLHLARVE